MEVDLKELENILNKAEVIYLSTSLNDLVSSRPISPMNMGLRLFIRTSAATRKAKEMMANSHIAACVGNFYFTGKARSLGPVLDESNSKIKEAYSMRYPGSFSKEDEFIETDEMFFELSITKVSEWIYENGVPVGLAERTIG